MPALGGDGGVQHHDGLAPQVGVQRIAHRLGRPGLGKVDVDHLAGGVDAGVGSSGGVNAHRLAAEGGDRPLQRALHCRLVRLGLEAVVGAAVVLEGEPEAGHQPSTVPAATGAPFVDAGIIGTPPRKGAKGPSFYASGPDAGAFAIVRDFGVDARVLDAPIGAASALKMAYAGITKGLTAVGSAMMLAATRSGAAKGLRDELAESQPALTPWFERQIPGMYQKAYRWVAEMREIAEFAGDDPAAAAMYEGVARFYERMAADEQGEKAEVCALNAFLAQKPEPAGAKRKVGYQDMIAAAEAEVTTLAAAQVIAMRGREDVALVDLRDPRELEREGRVPGALHCPRGMLEFWLDPESPYHKPVFSQPKTFVFFCAAGWRSALATQTAQRMGLSAVAHIGGGFKAWKEAGGEVDGGSSAA